MLSPIILVSAPAWRQGIGLSDDLYVTFYFRLLHIIFCIYRYSLPFEAASLWIYWRSDCVNTVTPRHEIFSGIFRSFYSRTSACQSPSSAWYVGGRASRIAFRIFSSLGLRIQRDSVNYLALSLHVLRAVRCDYCKTCLIPSDIVNQCLQIFQRVRR